MNVLADVDHAVHKLMKLINENCHYICQNENYSSKTFR